MNMDTTFKKCRITLDQSNKTEKDFLIQFFKIENGLKMGHMGTLCNPNAKSAF